MSPLELPGKSFGYLPDRRNTKCVYCGRGFRNFSLGKAEKDKGKTMFKLNCPFCGKQLDITDSSKVILVDENGERLRNDKQ